MTLLDDVLSNLLSDFAGMLHIEEDMVRVNLMGPAANFEIWLEKPDPKIAAEIREREGAAYTVPVRIRLVSRRSGKDVRGFNTTYINPWWLRRFVFNIAAAVAYIEREWDVISPAYLAKMEAEDES